MRVTIYEPEYNADHRKILRAFAAGIPRASVKLLHAFIPGETDIAVVFGWYKYAYRPTMAKRPIIDYPGHKLIIVESGFQKRGEYYQIGWNGFAGHADFRTTNVPGDRWQKLAIPVQRWRSDDRGDVTVIGQLPRDTQVQDVDHIKWCQDTVKWYQDHSYPVRFRPHPMVEDPLSYGIDPQIMVPAEWSLQDTLKNASLVTTWNSTTAVDALIAGVPVVAQDKGSIAYELAGQRLDEWRRPMRDQWFSKLGYSQWNLAEMSTGAPWRHLYP